MKFKLTLFVFAFAQHSIAMGDTGAFTLRANIEHPCTNEKTASESVLAQAKVLCAPLEARTIVIRNLPIHVFCPTYVEGTFTCIQ
jgi:hypothetical protein